MENNLFDVAAERAVLSAICHYNYDAYSDISDLVTVNSFTSEINQILYKCFSDILEEHKDAKIDLPSILSSTKSHFFEKREDKEYLRAIFNMYVEKENVRRLAGKVRKLEIARLSEKEMKLAIREIQDVSGDEPIDHILSIIEKPGVNLNSLLTTVTDGPQRIGDGVRKYIDFLSKNQRDVVGISTGYPYYDMAIGGGLRPGTVNMLGARAKVGKTALGDNISLHVSRNNIPVLNLDTEMSKEDHWNRMIANLSNIEINRIETGKFSNSIAEKKLVDNAIDILEKVPYDYISISGQPFEETLAIMRRWVNKKVGLNDNGMAKPCVIIFDYLKLMSSETISGNMAEFQALGFIMTGLHNFMVRWGIPCVAFVQLNRDGINREDTDVVSQSDRLIWLCSNFSIFKSKTPEEMAEQHGQEIYNKKLVPIVARHGAGLNEGDYINMMFKGSVCRITEGPTRNDLGKIQRKNEGIIVDATDKDLPFEV